MTGDRKSGTKDHGEGAPAPPARMAARWAWAWRTSVVLFVLWLLLSGPDAWLVGLGVALAGGLAGAGLAPGEPLPWRPWRLPGFFGYFLKASLLGGLDVARRAFVRRVDVEPCFAYYTLALPHGAPRTLMISLVSLLPGTLSANLDPGTDRLLVHALAPGAFETLAGLEQRIARLFGVQVTSGRAERVPVEDTV